MGTESPYDGGKACATTDTIPASHKLFLHNRFILIFTFTTSTNLVSTVTNSRSLSWKGEQWDGTHCARLIAVFYDCRE